MTRTITAGMVTEIDATELSPIIFVKFEYDSGDVNFWNGIGDLVWSGDTYTGAGNLGAISKVAETEGIIANDVNFQISGIPSGSISLALTEPYQGRPATMWIGAFDSSYAIVDDPIQVFKGSMDVMEIVEGGSTATITIRVENVLRALTRSSPRKWTDQDQQAQVPGDVGFKELPGIQDDPVNWKP